jgi:hypothetical protein
VVQCRIQLAVSTTVFGNWGKKLNRLLHIDGRAADGEMRIQFTGLQ